MKVIKEFIRYFKIGLKTISTSQIFLATTSVVTLILISVVVYRAISLRNKVNTIENNIEKKIETVVKIDYPDYIFTSKEGAAYLSECLKAPIAKEQLTDNLLNISKALESKFNESNYNFAFKYKDLYTGFTLSYNSTQPIFAASTIKAPEAIYIYEESEKGNIDLNDIITYTSNYYNEGTSILKNTKLKLKKLHYLHTL